MLATTTSHSQTQTLAAALAEIAEPGDLVLLVGDLGAGKTTFTQGFAAGLGISRQVTSPTFTLANEYRGRLLLNHLDVFRLEQISEVLDLDLFELLDGHGVTLIEWGNVVRQTLPDEYLEIALEFHDELEGSPKPISDHRTITLQLTGARWQARATTIQAALQPWLSSC